MPAKKRIVLATCNPFQILYLQPALEKAGAEIVAITNCVDEIRELVDNIRAPNAVVLSSNLGGGACWDIARELNIRGIAHIILIDPPSDDDYAAGTRSTILRAPYAAYQIVNWFEGVQADAST